MGKINNLLPLAISIEQLSTLFEELPLAMFISDMDNEIVKSVNKSLEKLFIVNKLDSIGKTIEELNIITNNSRIEAIKELELSGTLNNFVIETNHSKKASQKMLLSTKIIQIDNKNYSIHSIAKQAKKVENLLPDPESQLFESIEWPKRSVEKIMVDNSQHVANYTRSLIEAIRDPLFTISLGGTITDANIASEIVTDVVRNKLIGSSFINYFTEPEMAKMVYEEVFAKGFITDYPLVIKDGKLTDVLFNGSVYKDKSGSVIGAVVVARDTTEHKRIEKEFTEARIFAELATNLAEEAKVKAENATTVAQSAVKAKQQFLSNMSHEIRTPMNAILGFTKVVLKTELTAKQKEYLTAIKMSGDALIVLINDILDLAKVDAGKMTVERVPFKMELSVAAMMHLFEPKIQEKNLKLIMDFDKAIPKVLLGDAVHLHQIIINLISNAVKFTHEGKITITIKMLSETIEKVTIQFSIADTGIGIPPAKYDKIFENFQQASSGTSRLYGGTGLGLAIVKQLVELQEGTMKVESEEGVGSVFSFVLDFQKTNAKIESEIELAELKTDKKDIKVLVVEDIVLNQLLMKTLLDDFGFECDISANGKIAIDKLSTNRYDVVLMDLQMPEMNGFEAAEYIRKTLKLDIPIIALTADVTTVDLAKCKAVGMNDYISKPVDERILYKKILSFVTKQRELRSSIDMENGINNSDAKRCINLDYLLRRTKSNPVLIVEMIQAYLDQTPVLVNEMKDNFNKQNWSNLYASVHKMLPSFSIIGLHTNYESMARKILDYTKIQEQAEDMRGVVSELEAISFQACDELKEELIKFKKQINGES